MPDMYTPNIKIAIAPCLRILLGVFIVFSSLYYQSVLGADAQHEPLANIDRAAKLYLSRQFDADAEVDVQVSHLDSRLKLTACETALEVFLNNNSRPSGRVTAGVRCARPKPWTVYLPAEISVYKNVFAAARPLPRGYALTRNDLKLIRVDVSAKKLPYYIHQEDLIGLIVKRPLRSGVVLSANLFEPRHLVRRGEQVTLLAKTGGLQVRMKGKALSNGARGDVIPVRNLSSQRVVEGVVMETGMIQVNM